MTQKENFGLKLKIHYLEEMLRSADPNLNEKAIQENTSLKVDKATLQRELGRIKKQLKVSGREVEQLTKRLMDTKAEREASRSNQDPRDEFISLSTPIKTRNEEIQMLRQCASVDVNTDERHKLRGDIGDLRADVRGRDRLMEAKEDELDILKAKLSGMEEIQEGRAETAEHLNIMREEIEDLKAEVRTMDQLVGDKEDDIASLREKVESLESSEALRVQELQELRLQLASRDRELESTAQVIEARERELSAMAAAMKDLGEQEKICSALKEKIKALELNAKNLRSEVHGAEGDAQEAKRDRAEAESKQRTVEEELAKVRSHVAVKSRGSQGYTGASIVEPEVS